MLTSPRAQGARHCEAALGSSARDGSPRAHERARLAHKASVSYARSTRQRKRRKAVTTTNTSRHNDLRANDQRPRRSRLLTARSRTRHAYVPNGLRVDAATRARCASTRARTLRSRSPRPDVTKISTDHPSCGRQLWRPASTSRAISTAVSNVSKGGADASRSSWSAPRPPMPTFA